MHKIAMYQLKLSKDPEARQRFNYFLLLNSQYSKNITIESAWRNPDWLFQSTKYHLDSLVNKAYDRANNEAGNLNDLNFGSEGSTRASFNSDCREDEDDPEVSVKDIFEKLTWQDIWKQKLVRSSFMIN